MVDPSTIRMTGPLAPYRDGFWAELLAQGYAPLSSANQVRLMAHLSRWLLQQRLQPQDLSSSRIDEFLQHRRSAGYTCWCSPCGLKPVLRHLRGIGVVHTPEPSTTPSTPLDVLLWQYEKYLLEERGLTSPTVCTYLGLARRFLSTQLEGQRLDLGQLDAAAVTTFVLRESRSCCVGTARIKISALRSLLRFLHVHGDVPGSLAAAVPAVASRRLAGIPKALPPEAIRGLLRSCDRRSHAGRRDFAVLVLMARLGLRASEVAGLKLGDIDWEAGELVVCGKSKREDRLPLPADVGEAIVSYITRSRPRSTLREIFLLARAPYSSLTRSAISSIAKRAGRRAGLAPVSAHHLRHTAATQMLQNGASLSEIAQVLRHRLTDTTAIYAKIDRGRLREIAQPWPGAKP